MEHRGIEPTDEHDEHAHQNCGECERQQRSPQGFVVFVALLYTYGCDAGGHGGQEYQTHILPPGGPITPVIQTYGVHRIRTWQGVAHMAGSDSQNEAFVLEAGQFLMWLSDTLQAFYNTNMEVHVLGGIGRMPA